MHPESPSPTLHSATKSSLTLSNSSVNSLSSLTRPSNRLRRCCRHRSFYSSRKPISAPTALDFPIRTCPLPQTRNLSTELLFALSQNSLACFLLFLPSFVFVCTRNISSHRGIHRVSLASGRPIRRLPKCRFDRQLGQRTGKILGCRLTFPRERVVRAGPRSIRPRPREKTSRVRVRLLC